MYTKNASVLHLPVCCEHGDATLAVQHQEILKDELKVCENDSALQIPRLNWVPLSAGAFRPPENISNRRQPKNRIDQREIAG